MAIRGADISGWQPGNVNLAGLAFVYVKCTQGMVKVNGNHDAQVAQARAEGLVVGHYHFPAWGDPVAEAQTFVACSDWRPGEFMVLDIEDSPQTPWPADPVSWCVAFEREVGRLLGIWCMDYAGPNVRSSWNWAPLAAIGGGLIDPEYNPVGPSSSAPWANVAMWQNADTNQTGGDSDIFYGDAAALAAYGTPGAVALSGTITTIQEDLMTPEQANMLQAIFDAIFNGGKSMPEGLPLKDLVYSLPGRTAAATAAYPVIRGTQKIPWVQETADAKTALLLAKPAPAPVLDVQAFALEVAKQVAPLLPADQAHQFVVALGQALPKQ